jgi:hypothetical protein
MAKGAFGQKQGGALAIAWPKEEGSDFAGHEMAKRATPSLAIHWPKSLLDRPLATNSPTLTDWGPKGGGSLNRC